MKPLWKSLSKPFTFTLLIIFLIISIVSVLLNNVLTGSKGTIEREASKLFKQKISIGKIAFLFPNFVVLKDVAIQKTSPTEESQPVFIGRIKCMSSISMLIIKRDLVVTRMSIDKSNVSYPFIRENGEQILEAIRSLTHEQPLKIRFRKALLSIPQEGRRMRYINLEAKLAIVPDQSISGSGSINLEDFFIIPKLNSLNYRFRVFLTKEGFIIDNLEFKTLPLQLRFEGTLEENVLSMTGSAGLSDFPDLDIHDIACVIKFESPTVQIESLNFSMQDMPLGLRGSVSIVEQPALNLKFSSFPNQPQETRQNNPQAFSMGLRGVLRESKFNGTAAVDFIRKTKTRRFLEKVEIVFKNLSLFNNDDEKMRMSFDEAALSYISGNNAYNMSLKDFITLIQIENEMIKFVEVNSAIHDGILQGKGVLDATQMPFKSYFDARISGVSANKLHNLIMYCSKIYGELSSQIHYTSYPNPRLSGKVVINDGLLDNIIFFKWVADFLTIPSLSVVNFDTLSAEFIIGDEAASLENIDLKSKDVNLEGYFTLYENDLVSSKLSLVFAKELLLDSVKLRRLINSLDKDVSSVSFHFQLSGLFQAMNFKWLESDFKQTLQDLLPRWMERRLEGEIEKIIESISAQ